MIEAEGARLVRKCKDRIFSCDVFSGEDIQRPAGKAGHGETPQALKAQRRQKSEATAQLRQALLENAKNAFSSCDVYASEAYSCGGPEAEVALSLQLRDHSDLEELGAAARQGFPTARGKRSA